jgi:hypothetical protein
MVNAIHVIVVIVVIVVGVVGIVAEVITIGLVVSQLPTGGLDCQTRDM